MEKFWKWVTQSSVDPQKTALTAKALIVGVIPMAMFVAGFMHLHILPEQLQAIAELVRQIIEVGLGLITTGMFLFGLVRKLANLIRDIYLAWKQKRQQ